MLIRASIVILLIGLFPLSFAPLFAAEVTASKASTDVSRMTATLSTSCTLLASTTVKYSGNTTPEFMSIPKIKHPVLEVESFGELPSKPLAPAVFRELNQDLGLSTSLDESYVLKEHCFYNAELNAANQFRDFVVGKPEMQILEVAGEPTVILDPPHMWSKTSREFVNCLYFLGYEEIPIRLVLSHGKCVEAYVLSENEYHSYWGTRVRSESVNVAGKTSSEVVREHGRPQSIIRTSSISELYVYPVSRTVSIQIPFVNGRCLDDHGLLVARMSWKMKKTGPKY